LNFNTLGVKGRLVLEQDGTSDFLMLDGAISGIDIAIDIVKEIN
jgi:hypothetical protein